jgi:hypothetical protein
MSDSSDDDDDLFQPVFCKKPARQAPSHTRPTSSKTTSVEPPPQKFASTHPAKSLSLKEIQQKGKKLVIIMYEFKDW